MLILAQSILDSIPQLEQATPAQEYMVVSYLWLYVIGGSVLAVLLSTALILYLYLRPKKQVAGIAPAQIALQEISQLEKREIALREFSLELSLILRRFITGETQDPALFETHQEFTQRLDALQSIPLKCQNATREVLEELAEQKYAPLHTLRLDENARLSKVARELITHIKEEQEAQHKATQHSNA